MNLFRRIVVAGLCLSLALGSVAWGSAKKPLVAALKVRWKEKTISVEDQGKRHLVDVSDYVDAFSIHDIRLLFANRLAGKTYLLFDVEGPSRPRSAASHFCGAGTEDYLIWIGFEEDWDVDRIQSATYSSCLSTVEQSDPDGYTMDDKLLQAEYEDYRYNMRHKLVYDSTQPQRGLQITDSALPPTK